MPRLIALGDSHLEALKHAAALNLLLSEENEFCIVPGATAVGLRNPNSATQALEIFKKVLEKGNRASHVILHIGEVDCGFVIWWRAQKYGEPITVQFNDSLISYKRFIDDVLLMGYRKICITGASLPTIRDGVDFGDVANKRSEVQVSLYERTQLTLKYNQVLREFSVQRSLDYFDLSDAFLDKKEKILNDLFRNPISTDHHLDVQKTCGVWAYVCNRFLAS
ncbi:MAG: hypothetical protein U0V18_02680 [Anaerolineales bacterium]